MCLANEGQGSLKVKELIKNIERLATAEAIKKGFCDLELSKADKNRNQQFADVKRLAAEVASFNAKKDALEELEEMVSSLKESSHCWRLPNSVLIPRPRTCKPSRMPRPDERQRQRRF